jgi:hypothetical protein
MAQIHIVRETVEQSPISMEFDPMLWWAKQDAYAQLFPLVRMLLGIPASNASAERLFSSAGFLADGRDRLEIQTLEWLTIIRHFLVAAQHTSERAELIQKMLKGLDSGPLKNV